MKCPTCRADTFVVYTTDGNRRRRECFNGHRFTTIEVIHVPLSHAECGRRSVAARAQKKRDIAHAQESSL